MFAYFTASGHFFEEVQHNLTFERLLRYISGVTEIILRKRVFKSTANSLYIINCLCIRFPMRFYRIFCRWISEEVKILKRIHSSTFRIQFNQLGFHLPNKIVSIQTLQKKSLWIDTIWEMRDLWFHSKRKKILLYNKNIHLYIFIKKWMLSHEIRSSSCQNFDKTLPFSYIICSRLCGEMGIWKR